jgi:hypothetical protein
MEKMIGHCGIVCSECPTLHATQKDDDKERKQVAETWSKQFGFDLKPEDINCDGCLTDSDRLFGYCKACEVRACSNDKGLENCAHCGDFACDKLDAVFSMAPYAKKTLEKVRATL